MKKNLKKVILGVYTSRIIRYIYIINNGLHERISNAEKSS